MFSVRFSQTKYGQQLNVTNSCRQQSRQLRRSWEYNVQKVDAFSCQNSQSSFQVEDVKRRPIGESEEVLSDFKIFIT